MSRKCFYCDLELDDLSFHMVDADALDHIKEEHSHLIVDMINDCFEDDETDR